MYNKKYLIKAIENWNHFYDGEVDHIADASIKDLFKTDYKHFCLVESIQKTLYGTMTTSSPNKEEVLNYCKSNNIEVA